MNLIAPMASGPQRRPPTFIYCALSGNIKRRHQDRAQYQSAVFDPILEFGSKAITKVVNGKNVDTLRQSIAFLEKGQQRIIRENFNFLLENEIRCVSLTPAIVEDAHQLLWDFRNSGHNLKESFRNSWNDILILATARNGGGLLVSDDNGLNRFAASSLRYLDGSEDVVEITLNTSAKRTAGSQSRESKGYINRGWRANFDKAGL